MDFYLFPGNPLDDIIHSARLPYANFTRKAYRFFYKKNFLILFLTLSLCAAVYGQEPDVGYTDSVKKMLPILPDSTLALGDSRENALSFAIRSGDLGKVEYLLEVGADLHYLRPGGYDALIDAAYGIKKETKYDLLKLLIRRGAAVDGQSDYGESALGVASRNGRFDIVRLLLDAGDDLERLQWTPLMHAVVFGKVSDVRKLLDKRPYTAERDPFHRTAFLLAVQAGRREMAGLLLETGASLEESGRQGRTVLSYAVQNEDVAMLAWLLKLGADVNEADDYGYTALMYAQSKECARLLLEAGADFRLKNHIDKTALQSTGNPEIARLLIEYGGGDWNDTNEDLRRTLVGLPVDYEIAISEEDYQQGKNRRYGKNNPEKTDVPFWREMVKSGAAGGSARMELENKNWATEGFGKAIWSYQRFGKSINLLPDNRIVEIGGEHEDYYDVDFCIYNDVFVFDGQGGFTIYAYPKEVFPPTDFHSATLVGAHIYIIGGLGYRGERRFGETPVYRLNTRSFVMERIDTDGENPGWIYDHRASLDSDGNIRISGGKVCEITDNQEQIRTNERTFILDLSSGEWRRE